MEGMAVATSIDKILATLGMGGTLILMGVIAYFVIREVKKENENTRKSFDGFRKSIEARIDKIQEQSDEHDRAIEKRLEQAEKDIKFLGKEGVTKEMLYRETEGWRSEIQNISNMLNRLPFDILKLTEGRKNEK